MISAAEKTYSTDEERWEAVAARDRQADGMFYYSVATTGVYCRPSCASRPALRKNIEFYQSCTDAERAGFRPCKRCRPNEPSLEEQHAEAIAKACRVIDASESFPGLDTLAAAAGMGRFHFGHLFKAITGVTPRAYFQAKRSERMRDELKASRTVTEAIYNAGFNSNGRFYAQTDKALGMTPRSFRAGGRGTTIRFALGSCMLGNSESSILVAATEKGICSIAIGDDPQVLLETLQNEFPQAELVGADREFESWVAQIIGFVERPDRALDLPLDIQGTAFQQRVWRALRDIPPGQTASYSEVAARIGSPQATRAVAHACASNRLALAIPCHRVVRNDGAPSGYRWGLERKQALLEREAHAR